MLSSAGPAERGAVEQVLCGRFGLPADTLAGLRLLATSRVVWAVADHARLDEALAAFAVDRTGLPLLRRVADRWKPTTVALQALGTRIAAAVVDLDAGEVDRLLADGSLHRTEHGLTEGYVALRGPDGVIGCGLYLEPRPEENLPDGLVRSLLPKAEWEVMGRHLREDL